MATNYCFELKRYGAYSTNIINSSCSTANSGTITLGKTLNNTVTYAVFKATIGGEDQVIATAWTEVFTDTPEVGVQGIFLTFIVFMVMIFLSQVGAISIILGTLSLLFAKLIGIFTISWPAILGVVFAGILVGLLMGLKKCTRKPDFH